MSIVRIYKGTDWLSVDETQVAYFKKKYCNLIMAYALCHKLQHSAFKIIF